MVMRLYVVRDDIGMAVIAARSPEQCRQMQTWEWGHVEPIHIGDAPASIQSGPEIIEEFTHEHRSKNRFWQGMTFRERMWAELDTTYDRIMGMQEGNEEQEKQNKKLRKKGKEERALPADPLDILAAQNYALGLAFALAYSWDPANPSIDAIRETAAERWEERNADE